MISLLTTRKCGTMLASLLNRREFWGGVALSSPFYAEFFPWHWAVTLTLPLALCVTLYPERIKAPHASIVPIALLLMIHGVALLFTETQFAYQVFKDMVLATFLLAIYLLANRDTSDGLFLALLPLGLASSTIGLFKAGLLDRGYLIGFILDTCASYPAGSALCVNYNNLGLIWLVTALGCLRGRLWPLLPILFAAGALSSSRRFLLLALLLPAVWILIDRKFGAIKAAAVGVFALIIISAITDPVSFERYRFGAEPYTVLFGSSESSSHTASANENINRSAPLIILGTMGDGTLGTATRLDYWNLAFKSIGWLPQGWTYHETFSCSFSPCTEFHYPHLTLLSEWIIGGALAGVLAVLFYAFPLSAVLRRREPLPIALAVVILPYSVISGDTVFSLPICISCILVALSSIPRKDWKSF